ncbi:MAG: patatin-like phospholipase family protein, partial [Bacteroidetes bacterium]|nr:patatin-like phospholipase family protein [Bacteroidota bacterium]
MKPFCISTHCVSIFFSIFLFTGFLSGQQQTITVTPLYAEQKSDTFSTLVFKSVKHPTVCLVLSGGGSRGIAHLGVIKELERNNIPIDFIVGTSIGGIIGGLYASGYTTEQLENIIDTTDWNYVLSLTQETERQHLYLSHKVAADRKQLTLRFEGLTPILPSAVSSGQRLTTFINQLTLQSLYHPVSTFDDLKIPFRCISTDLISGKQIVFHSGNLSEALRASISIPLLYNPLKKDTLQLTDGGLMANIPVNVARSLGADIIIAVNTTSPLRSANQLNYPWEVTDQIVNIMAQEANKRALDSATIVITPDLGYYPSTDFSNLKFAVQQGVYAARTMITAIHDTIEDKQQEMMRDNSPLSSFAFLIRSIEHDSMLVGPLTSSSFRSGDST